MPEREPTAEDVKVAFANFRKPWDFDAIPVLHLPLIPPMSVFDVVVPDAKLDGPMESFRVRHATIKLEHGYLHGRRARRLVGTVEGTDINVVLETHIVR